MTNNLCRYCPTTDCYKEISQEYYWAGQKEKYTDIFLETFNITISNKNGCKQLICEGCIKKLRDAAAFKHQVQQVEGMLEKSLESLEDGSKIEATLPLKDEPEDFEDNTSVGYHDEVNDYKWQINNDDLKTESDGDIFVIKLLPKRESHSKTKRESKNSKLSREKKSIKKINKKKKIKGTKKDEKRKPLKISQTHIDMKENSIKLIINSNMCLFESLKTKFRCFSCKETFRNIIKLRDHSKTHDDVKQITNKVNRVRMSYKNTDISNLTCKICSENLNDLTDLKQHLTTHDIKFSGDNHLLIPYKLENDFICVICKEKFNTFMRLSIHMNSHSTNNVCEICGVSYINRISLRMHVSSMHRVKKCSICLAMFKTNYSRVKHMKDVHNTAHYKRYCLECNKTFQYTYMLVEHMIKDHGLKRDTANCSECGKTFQSPANLRVHMRAVHIKERNYPCNVCSMRFFTKCDQRRHERTHNDVRSYSCSFCEGKFKSKDSWRRHLKRQHGQYDE